MQAGFFKKQRQPPPRLLAEPGAHRMVQVSVAPPRIFPAKPDPGFSGEAQSDFLCHGCFWHGHGLRQRERARAEE